MTRTRTAYTRRLRRSRTGVRLSLFAMLLQFLFTLDHVSAMAVAAARGGPDGSPLGLLQICTAQGLIRIPAPNGVGPDGRPLPPASHNGGADVCVLCGTAAVSGSSGAPLFIIPLTAPPLLQGEAIAMRDWAVPGAAPVISGSARGPPVC